MARILLAWEMGGGYGHIRALRLLADRLAAAGHDIVVATRDPVRHGQVFAGSGHRLLCAPLFQGVVMPPAQLCSLADVIWYESGGHSAATLAALLHSWRQLYQTCGIDLLVADAAPCAIAAAQGLLPVVGYDAGFHATDAAGWGIYRDWERIDARMVELRASTLLDHLNQVRRQLELPAVEQLQHGFACDRLIIRNLPELDLWGERDAVVHAGVASNPGQAPRWPAGDWQHRLFVYVRGNHPHHERLLGALTRLEHCAVLLLREGEAGSKVATVPHLQLCEGAQDLALLLPEVTAVVCHGGAVQVQCMQHGVPTLTLPMHAEQYVQARRAQATEASLMLSGVDRPDFLGALRRVLTEPAYRAAARAMAARHAPLSRDPLEPVLDAIHALLPDST